MRHFSSINFLLLVLAFFWLGQCTPRQVIREGVTMPYEKAAQLDYQLAEEALTHNQKDKALEILNHLVKTYPASAIADDGQFKLGEIHLKEGRLQEAELHFRSVLEDFYFSPLKSSAQHRLGMVLFLQNEFAESIATLEPIAAKISQPSERLEVLHLISSAHEKLNAPQKALPIWRDMIQLMETSQLTSGMRTDFSEIPSAEFLRGKIAAAGARIRVIENAQNVVQNKVGVILPLSGSWAAYGQETLAGIEIAAATLNENYPGLDLEFVIRDSRNDPQIAAQAVQDLATQEGVMGIIGPLFAADSQAAAKEAQTIGIPLVSLSGVEGISEIGSYVFRNALVMSQQAQILVNFSLGQSVNSGTDAVLQKKFAILYPQNNYGLSMRDAFWNEVNKRGGEVVAVESYKPGATDFRNEIKKLVGLYDPEPRQEEWKALRKQGREKGRRAKDDTLPPIVDFQAIFVPDAYTAATLIADHLPYFDIKGVQLLGDSQWNHPALITRGKRNIQGAIFTDGFFSDHPSEKTRIFVANYFAAFEQIPKRHSAYAYDTTEIFFHLLQGGTIKTREALRTALAGLKDFEGVTGRTSFSQRGEVQKSVFLLKVEGDKIVEVK